MEARPGYVAAGFSPAVQRETPDSNASPDSQVEAPDFQSGEAGLSGPLEGIADTGFSPGLSDNWSRLPSAAHNPNPSQFVYSTRTLREQRNSARNVPQYHYH
jgi:hypothetical protein